jgi:hypothetical protein
MINMDLQFGVTEAAVCLAKFSSRVLYTRKLASSLTDSSYRKRGVSFVRQQYSGGTCIHGWQDKSRLTTIRTHCVTLTTFPATSHMLFYEDTPVSCTCHYWSLQIPLATLRYILKVPLGGENCNEGIKTLTIRNVRPRLQWLYLKSLLCIKIKTKKSRGAR